MDWNIEVGRAIRSVNWIKNNIQGLLKPWIVISFVVSTSIGVLVFKYHNLILLVLVSSVLYWLAVFLYARWATLKSNKEPKKDVVIEAEWVTK